MRNATCTALIGILVVGALSLPTTATADDDIPLSRQVFETNNVRYEPAPPPILVKNATDRQRQQVETALGLFDALGLELPPLIIKFAEDLRPCEGNLGTYRPHEDGPAVVTICTKMRLTLIHELAHAWDDHMLDDRTREAFMGHWDLDNWNDRTEDWHDRGSERAADTIAYTLLLDEPSDNPDILQFVCGYGLLTGQDLPVAAAASCGV